MIRIIADVVATIIAIAMPAFLFVLLLYAIASPPVINAISPATVICAIAAYWWSCSRVFRWLR